jgi:hypothetical protein
MMHCSADEDDDPSNDPEDDTQEALDVVNVGNTQEALDFDNPPSTADRPLSLEEFMLELNLKSVVAPTAWKWLRQLGYKHADNTKCYYVDGHEKPEQQAYRKKFIRSYFKHEIQGYRWVQLTEDEAMNLEDCSSAPLMKNIYHPYFGEKNGMWQQLREYHVDCHPAFADFVSPTNVAHGGDLSVRRDRLRRPLIIIGQDESAFNAYSFRKKAWKGPNGESFILPKGEGDTVMISAFQSRSFGLGLGRGLSEVELQQISALRNGRHYYSEDAAREILSTTEKPQINEKEDPLVRFFDMGKDREGYWNYSHMALQMEDVIDCLQVLYSHHDFLFLLDQSSGHGKKQSDGLNAHVMNKEFGGKQPRMRSTEITEG